MALAGICIAVFGVWLAWMMWVSGDAKSRAEYQKRLSAEKDLYGRAPATTFG